MGGYCPLSTIPDRPIRLPAFGTGSTASLLPTADCGLLTGPLPIAYCLQPDLENLHLPELHRMRFRLQGYVTLPQRCALRQGEALRKISANLRL